MTNFTYTLNIPATNNNPSQDQPNMLQNNNNVNGIIGVDHITFNAANGGYHTITHQVPQSDPANINGIGQLYSKNVTVNSITDTQLFYETGLGGISQLTGNHAATNGYNWMGGILFQWGFVNTASSGSFASGYASGSVNFTLPFPHAPFLVIATPFWTTTPPSSRAGDGTVTINSANLSTTSFSWQFTAPSTSQYTGFYWISIGN